MCVVIDLTNHESNQVQALWTGAGFTGLVTFNPDWPPKYTIVSQSIPEGDSVPCTSGITVFG
jgi:hypothetical protein